MRLRYPDVETFIEKFATNVSRGGIFIRTREPREVEELVRFEFQLQDGKPVFRGEGKVVWVKEWNPEEPAKACGMGLKFTRLDRKSRELIDRILEHKAKRKPGPAQVEEAEAEVESEEPDETPVAVEEKDERQAPSAAAEPVEAEAGEPVEAAAGLEAEPVEAEAVEAAAGLEAEPVEAEPVEVEPVEVEPVEAEPVEAGPEAEPEAGPEAEPVEAEEPGAEPPVDEAEPASEAEPEGPAENEVALPSAERAPEPASAAEGEGAPRPSVDLAELARAVRDAVASARTVEELMELPLDIGAVLAREGTYRPLIPARFEDELALLEPEGFETAAAMERLRGWDGVGFPRPAPVADVRLPLVSEQLEEPVEVDPAIEPTGGFLPAPDAEASPAASLADLYDEPEPDPSADLDVSTEVDFQAGDIAPRAGSRSSPARSSAESHSPPAGLGAGGAGGYESPGELEGGAVFEAEEADSTDLLDEGTEASSSGALFETGEIPSLLDDLMSPQDGLLGGGAGDGDAAEPMGEGPSVFVLEEPTFDGAAEPREPPTRRPVRPSSRAGRAQAEGEHYYRGEPIVQAVQVDVDLDGFDEVIQQDVPGVAATADDLGRWDGGGQVYDDDEVGPFGEGAATQVQPGLSSGVGSFRISSLPALQEEPVDPSRSEADYAIDELMADLEGPATRRDDESGPDLLVDDDLLDATGRHAALEPPEAEAFSVGLVQSGQLPVLHDLEGDEAVPTFADRVDFGAQGLAGEGRQAAPALDGRGATRLGVPIRVPDGTMGDDAPTLPRPRPSSPLTIGPDGVGPEGYGLEGGPPQMAPPERPSEPPPEGGEPQKKRKGFFRKLFGGGE